MDDQTAQPTNPPVESNAVQPTSPIAPPLPSKPFLSGKIIILIVIILVILTGGGAYFVLNSRSKPAPTVSQAVSTSAPTPTPDPTASWKTYTSAKNSFYFKYPESWFSQDIIENGELPAGTNFYITGVTPHPGGADNPTNAQLNIQLSNNTQTNDQFIKTAPQTAGYQKTLTIGGFPAIKSQIKNFKQYYIKYSSTNLLILSAYTSDAGNSLDVIVSLIKFTDTNQNQANSLPIPNKWIKYQASCASLVSNVEIYYPDGWRPKEFGNIGAVTDPNSKECQVLFGYPVQPESYQASTPGELAEFKVQTFIDSTETLDQRVQTISNQDPKAKFISKVTINGITWSKVDYDSNASNPAAQTWLSTKVGNKFIEIYLIGTQSIVPNSNNISGTKLVDLKNTEIINNEILNRIKILVK